MKFIGIDGGGTKSIAFLSDENLNILRIIERPSTNYLSVGINQVKYVIKNIISSLVFINEPYILSLGLSGVNRDVDIEQIKKVLDELKVKNYIINNDAYIALYGAHIGQDGALLIAGTGSILYNKSESLITRAGGYGHLLGDRGSAYSIAKMAIIRALEANDRLNNYHNLLEFVKNFYSVKNIEDIIPKFHNKEFKKSDIALLTKSMLTEVNNIRGIKSILEVESEALCYLCNILPKGSNISLSGSLLDSNNYFSELVKNRLTERHRIIEKAYEPAYGALLIAEKSMSGKGTYDNWRKKYS